MYKSENTLFVRSLGFSGQQFATKELYDLAMKKCKFPTLTYRIRENNESIGSSDDSSEAENENEINIETTEEQCSGSGDKPDYVKKTGQKEINAKHENILTSILNTLQDDALKSETKERRVNEEFDVLKNENEFMKRRLEALEEKAAQKDDDVMTKSELLLQRDKYVTVERNLKLLEDDVKRNKKNYVMSREHNTLKDKHTLLERRIKMAEDEMAQKNDITTKEAFRELQNKYAIVEEKLNKLEDGAPLQNGKNYAATSRELSMLKNKNTVMEKRIETLEDELSRKNEISIKTVDQLSELREKYNIMEQRVKTLEDHSERVDELFERFGGQVEKLSSQLLNNNNNNAILPSVDKQMEKELKEKNEEVRLLAMKNEKLLMKLAQDIKKDIKDVETKLATAQRDRHAKGVTKIDFDELKSNVNRAETSYKIGLEHLGDLYRTLENACLQNDSNRVCPVAVEDEKIDKILWKYDKLKMRLGGIEKNVTKNSMALVYYDDHTDRTLKYVMMVPPTCYREFDGLPMTNAAGYRRDRRPALETSVDQRSSAESKIPPRLPM